MKLDSIGIVSATGVGAAGLLAIVGAILPWAEGPFGISKAGVEGDGALTLLAGLFLGVLALLRVLLAEGSAWRWTFVAASWLLGLITLIVAIVDIADVERVATTSDGLIKAGSGLYVTALAGAIGIGGASLLGLLSDAREK